MKYTLKPVVVGRLAVEPVRASGPWWRRWLAGQEWRLTRELVIDFYGVDIHVVRGHTTDFASVPRLLKPLFSGNAIFSAASVWHDECYRTGRTSKWMADAGFYELLRWEGVAWPMRAAMWVGVWIGGWPAWRGHRRRERQQGEGGRLKVLPTERRGQGEARTEPRPPVNLR